MRFVAAVAALALSACVADHGTTMQSSLWATRDGRPPIIIAHRGASGFRPEHTLEAYALAIDMGADVVEPDLVFSRDGVLVARHDRYLSTTTDVADHPEFASRKRANDDPDDDPSNLGRDDWWVEDFTLAELKTLRARQPFPGRSKEFDGLYEIPTFDEILALVTRNATGAGRPVGVYPETKHPGFFASIGHDFETPLLTALKGFNAGPVFIQSFEPEILNRLKGKTTAKLAQLVYEKTPGAGPNIPLEEIAKYADGVGPSKELILRVDGVATDRVRVAHELGLLVHAWTFRNDRPNDQLERSAPDVDPQKLGASLKASGVAVIKHKYDWARLSVPNAAGEEFNYFFRSGVDGVFTDFPDTAVKVRNAMTPPASK